MNGRTFTFAILSAVFFAGAIACTIATAVTTSDLARTAIIYAVVGGAAEVMALLNAGRKS